MPRPSNRKTKNMVFSRPRKSETQPKNGLVSPLRTRSIVNANVSAGRVMPINVIGVVSRWKSLAMGLSCAVAISPPAAISTNITYMTQNVGSLSTCSGLFEHQQRQQDHNKALANTEGEKCILVAVR